MNHQPNRLIHETSPYLLQHAYNPVDWYPWGPEALQKAQDENKIILVSIGYSACHWCHVMERESFENAETAAIMNRDFVNIKIDREERPDLDQVYMDAVQTISGSGGWPLNCFLTPNAKPFYGGTYFPPVNAYNRSSWREVLHAIQSAWADKPLEILAQAENLTDHLSKAGLLGSLNKESIDFSNQDLQNITENLLKSADKTWGGFGGAPKFPQTFSIQFLLRQHYHNQKDQKLTFSPLGDKNQNLGVLLGDGGLLSQALLSLDKMIYGGIYDQLQGGFARYSTDAKWLAPHFEKMLYDNALLISVISEAYQVTQLPLYKNCIEQTMQFIGHEWQDTDGGFFSAYDADSEGEEGKYYTWQKSEVQALITEEDKFFLFADFYNITEEGNWEHTNILWVKEPLGAFCEKRGLDPSKTEEMLAECRGKLLEVRSRRIKPLLDDKKLLGWNALMITACCKAWNALGNDIYLAMAEKAASFISQHLKDTAGVYYHNYKNGKAANPAFLEDLACYIQAMCHLQECTGDFSYLDTARDVTDLVITAFADSDSPFFFYTPNMQSDIIFRKIDMYDGAVPSGNSTMAINLLYLGTMFNTQTWKERAVSMGNQMRDLVTKYPTSFALWAQLFQWLLYGLNEVAVVGSAHKKVVEAVLKAYLPNKIVQHAACSSNKYPLIADKEFDNDKTLIYLCREFACQQPVLTADELVALI
jgi:uncharacterized protein YyaL (SSP411 family)